MFQPRQLTLIKNQCLSPFVLKKAPGIIGVILEQDLFEDWVITIINGRINTKLGGIRKLAFSNVSDAIVKLDAITQTRIKRKYMQL